MAALFARLLATIQLTRLTIAFGAVSDLWFVVLLSRAGGPGAGNAGHIAEMPAWAAYAAGAIVAVGLHAYGASLNDVLDVRHDAAFSPERPIPAGRIRVGHAAIISTGALLVAILAAAWIGLWSVCLTLLTAAGIVFYNATGRFIPAVGAITLGLIHAAHMFIPNAGLAFTLPIWLVMTHTAGIAAAVHVLEDKRPKFRPRAIAAAAAGWLAWSIAIVLLPLLRGAPIWPEGVSPLGLVWPCLAILGYLAVARWKAVRVPHRAAAEKLNRYGAMWHSVYGAAWLEALGLSGPALAMLVLAGVGFAVMTLVKEVVGYGERVVGYRVR